MCLGYNTVRSILSTLSLDYKYTRIGEILIRSGNLTLSVFTHIHTIDKTEKKVSRFL